MTTRVIINISELTTNDGALGDGSPAGRLFDAAMVLDEHHVLWVGANGDAPDADVRIDAQNSAVLPGFVDSHTHLVFAGERSDEFEARMAGEPYDGGGIARTVAATRAASSEDLRRTTQQRVDALRAGGVTTIEIKSGYELTVEGERRLVGLAKEWSDDVTFLGAHVVPAEFSHDRDAYVELVGGAMLASCAPKCRWADVFCDAGAFSVDEARSILLRARNAGLGLRVHGNQLGDTGGVALAVELGASSVDHCSHVNDGDLEALAASSTVATLLPGAEFSTKSPYPSARRLLDAGVTVALATDCNPGTSYITNMGVVIALAVREMGMTVDEAIWAATLGGALALQRDDVGHLSPGARAHLVILDAPRSAHVAYRVGSTLVRQVLRD
jgi:imidazolonepropionase